MSDQAKRFMDLFLAGPGTGHGFYTLIGDGTGGKSKTEGKRDNAHKGFAHEEITLELWEKHLAGKQGLGVPPLRRDGTVRWGAIDIDAYSGLDRAGIAKKLLGLQLPLVVCRSKSGGAHIYLFTSEPVGAGSMQVKLRDISAVIGHGGVEIFPVQTKISEKDQGAWINAPYYGGEDSKRCAILPDGEEMTADQFLDYAYARRVAADFFSVTTAVGAAKVPPDQFPDGPPCLNHLAQMGFPAGTRDKGLFNIALYYKKADPEWKTAVEEANRTVFTEPLTSPEVAKILKSVEGKEYLYQCKQEPLSSYCNSVRCRMRKYGISGGANDIPHITGLRKMDTDPPMYFLDMIAEGETKTIELSSDQVQDPRLFKKRVWEVLDICIGKMKQETWDNTLMELKRSDRFKIIDMPPEASVTGQAWDLVEEFCTFNPARNKEEILMGRPWTEMNRTFIRMSYLMKFMLSQNFKDYKVPQLAKLLHTKPGLDANKKPLAEATAVTVKGHKIRGWWIPAFDAAAEGFEVPDSITNKKEEGLF